MKNKAGTQAYTLFRFKLRIASKSHGIDLHTNIKPAMHELLKPSACYHSPSYREFLLQPCFSLFPTSTTNPMLKSVQRKSHEKTMLQGKKKTPVYKKDVILSCER